MEPRVKRKFQERDTWNKPQLKFHRHSDYDTLRGQQEGYLSCLKTGLGVRWGRTGLALSLLWDLPVLGTRDQIFGISHHSVLLPYCLGQLYWFTIGLLSLTFVRKLEPAMPMGADGKKLVIFPLAWCSTSSHPRGMAWIYEKANQKIFSGQKCVGNGI